MVEASCRGCWYLLRSAAAYSGDATLWAAWDRYDRTGDPAAMDTLHGTADIAVLQQAKATLIAMGLANPAPGKAGA